MTHAAASEKIPLLITIEIVALESMAAVRWNSHVARSKLLLTTARTCVSENSSEIFWLVRRELKSLQEMGVSPLGPALEHLAHLPWRGWEQSEELFEQTWPPWRASAHTSMFSFVLSAEGEISPNWGDATIDFYWNGTNGNLHSGNDLLG